MRSQSLAEELVMVLTSPIFAFGLVADVLVLDVEGLSSTTELVVLVKRHAILAMVSAYRHAGVVE
jgi:hypothetical protein